MLLGNYSVLNRNPIKYLGGSTASPEVNHTSNFLLGGKRKNRQYVGMTTAANKQFSLPYGNYPPYMTLLPQKGGDLSAHRSADFNISSSATGGMGMPGTGSATITITTNTPDGQLIVSGTGSVSFTIDTNTPLLTASIGGDGTASFTIDTNTPVLGAEASLVGSTTITITPNAPAMLPTDTTSPLRTATATFTFTGTLERYALGNMVGTTVDSGTVTNASVASAVWDELLASHATAGSAGLALSTASSGGVDPSILAAAVWAYVSRTLTSGAAPTEAQIAAAVLAAAQAAPIKADIQTVRAQPLKGDGSPANPWNPV